MFSCNNELLLPQYINDIKRFMFEGHLPLRKTVSKNPSALGQLFMEEKSFSNPVKVLGYLYETDWGTLCH